jgi:hypothetical protein
MEAHMRKHLAALVPIERIENRILLIRGQKVLLDRDLAVLYDVKPIALRQQIRRNIERFPADFMFQLTGNEADLLVSQNVIPSKQSLGGSLPYVFTQEGVAMLSGVLKSQRAVKMNIAIMRAFVRMREMLLADEKMAKRLSEIEERMDAQEIHTIVIMDKLRALSAPEKMKKAKIGFIHTP